MREGLELLRGSRQSQAFFLTLAQPSLGTGAGYVALLLGPVFGAIADRWSRRWCAVAADLVRLLAFVGIALVDSFAATVALAAVAGIGTGLFMPATVAGLASITGEKRLPAGTALYGAASDFGYTVGPAVACGYRGAHCVSEIGCRAIQRRPSRQAFFACDASQPSHGGRHEQARSDARDGGEGHRGREAVNKRDAYKRQ